ncbi:L-lactate permease [Ornithinimicrobium avium]|uniref:L-lactate permease n=1 Tax=Ornithinimicrobium avium TaxID=2283195 RepID=A0A345NSE9_9MICO|nr:L-lactate permease [Ornithinimicrobium avium]
MRFLAALAPIVLVLVLLVVRVPSMRAGVVGLVGALVVGATAFPIGRPEALAVLGDMGPLVVEIAVILLGGVGLAQVMTRGGAQGRIAEWLEEAERGADRTLTLLLLVFGLTPFMESVTGFGLGVVITAPLLVRLGLTPVRAVVTGMLGMVLVPWGSMAPGLLVAAQLGGQDFVELGVWTAVLTLPVLVVGMVGVLALNVGRPRPPQLLLATVVVLVQWAVLIPSNLLGPPLAGVLASAAIIALLLGVTRLARGPLPPVTRELLTALVPYVVLVAGILAATALLALAGDGTPGWITSPALWLVVAAAVATATVDLPSADRWALVAGTLRRWVPIAGNAIVFMLIGIVMAGTGMAEHLAVTAAGAGYGFVAAVPAVGALGGYLTGSNTGSAAMFSAATTNGAATLGADPLVALAGQNVAGSIAIIASPPRVALATGVVLEPGERLPPRAVAVLLGVVLASTVILGLVVLALA